MRPLILKGHSRPLTMVKYNHEGDLLFSCGKDDTPTLWFTSSGERIGTYEGHIGAVWSLDVNRDSTRLLTSGGDQTVKLWDVQTGKLLANFEQGGPARYVEWAEGDNMFLVVTDPFSKNLGEIRIYTRKSNVADDAVGDEGWDYISWSKNPYSPGNKVTRATWCALNRYIITGNEEGSLRMHEPRSGDVVSEVKEHKKKINSLQWNKEKNLLITGSADCTSKVFDVASWQCINAFVTEVPVNAAAISPIKEHAFVGGGQEAMNVTTTAARVGKFETKLFHLVFGDEFGTIRGHFGPVNTLALHPDGTGFTSGSEDGYIRIHSFDKDYFGMHSEFDDLDALMAMTGGSTGEEQ